MPENTTNKARLKEITDSIESGIKDLFQSDKYAQYLRTMSRFHKYSMNNTMLIYLQRPDATAVAGFNKWRDQFSRNVIKGERGIKIIAPTPYRKKIEQQKLDPDTKLPITGADGEIVMEEKTVQIPMYKPVTVFDVAQTEGKPLPELAADLQGNVHNYEVFMEALRRSAPVPISIETMSPDKDGFFSAKEQRIAIREGMSEVQTVSAAVHEIAHSKLHNAEFPEVESRWSLLMVSDDTEAGDIVDEYNTREEAEAVAEAAGWRITDKNGVEWNLEVTEDTITTDMIRKSRGTEEVEAESVSFAVCAYYGIATGENSLGYIASWSKDKELSELRASLETINKTASGLITDIDRNYAEIVKERGLDKAEPELETEPIDGDKIVDVKVETYDPNASLPPFPEDYPMPDPTVSIAARDAYGYTDNDMLPLSHERAVELFEQDATVYMLHPGNGAGMAFDMDDIDHHDGLFGIRHEDWEAERSYLERAATHEPTEQELESRFVDSPVDAYAIYQLKSSDDTRDLRFESLKSITDRGLSVERGNYDLVYTAAFDRYSGQRDRLEDLWEKFNINQPEDFRHHSLSVSDIIAIKESGKVSYHYVDSTDFVELPDFKLPENYLKNAEMSTEDDYGMIDGIINNGTKPLTTADFEQQVKAGQSISLADFAEAIQREAREKQGERPKDKPSVLAKLKALSNPNDYMTAPGRSAERERE